MPVPESHDALYSVHSPFRLASISVPRNDRFPDLGAHTGAVLQDAGYTTEEIAELAVDGIVQGYVEMPR
jgi:crotonobetainyl-CoA:carnitine CoA-transferase CaiB-like acyl-CoA transferase